MQRIAFTSKELTKLNKAKSKLEFSYRSLADHSSTSLVTVSKMFNMETITLESAKKITSSLGYDIETKLIIKLTRK